MPFEHYILTYGYLALFLGTLLEGETVVIIAGYLAHRGYLSWAAVFGIACLGSFLGDQFSFYLGRKWGMTFLQQKPHWQKRLEWIRQQIERHQNWIVVGFRFVYGMRLTAAVIIGASSYSRTRFVLLNGLGSFIWATLFSALGYFLGRLVQPLFADIKKYELAAILLVLGFGGVIILVQRFIWRRKIPDKV